MICTSVVYSKQAFTLESFVEKALYSDRLLQEKKASYEKSRIEAKYLARQAYLPKFELGMAMGPAPSIHKETRLEIAPNGDSITSIKDNYDFTSSLIVSDTLCDLRLPNKLYMFINYLHLI